MFCAPINWMHQTYPSFIDHYQNKRLYIGKNKLKITNTVTVSEFDWFTSCKVIHAMVFFSIHLGVSKS